MLPHISKMRNKGSSHHKAQQRTCPQSELCPAPCTPSLMCHVCTEAVAQMAQGHLLWALCFPANASGSNELCVSSREQKCLLQPCQLTIPAPAASAWQRCPFGTNLYHSRTSQCRQCRGFLCVHKSHIMYWYHRRHLCG